MAPALKEKVVKGISWNLLERVGGQGMTFVLGIILARLLTPEDYGLIGMIAVFIAISEVFIQSGFGQAYIQKKTITHIDAATIFYTNITISILLYAGLWFAAPFISRFYEQPALIELTRVLGFVIILHALNIIQQAKISRGLDFKRKTKITITATFLAGIAGITSAYGGLGVWSLVVKILSKSVLVTFGLWITSKWKPTWHFSIKSFKEMFSFGAWILAANIIRVFFDNIYKLIIGKFFPVAQLGFYTKAKGFQQMASQNLTGAVSSVAFPAFSKIQDEKLRLQNAMQNILTHTTIFILPLMVTFIVVAEPFVMLLLTEKWAPMIPYLQLFCIIGFLYPIQSVNIQVLLAQGKSKLNFNLSMLKNVLRVLNIIIMYRYGVINIIMGEVILSCIALIINTYYTKILIDYGLIKQLRDIARIVVGASIAGFLTFLFISISDSYFVQLFVGASLSMGIYICTQYLLNKALLVKILALKSIFTKDNSIRY